jgi:hypothetical protein
VIAPDGDLADAPDRLSYLAAICETARLWSNRIIAVKFSRRSRALSAAIQALVLAGSRPPIP